MKRIALSDVLTGVEAKTHKDGYKVVRAKVARTGIQEYNRYELGDAAPVGNPSDKIRVYRPADQVFSDQSLNGWSHVPITLDHPPELVTPDNYRDYAVGEVTSKAKVDDDGWLWLEFLVKDKASIVASDTTHKQYSGGYTAYIDFNPGVTDAGEEYDAIQSDINPNHLALVPSGRAFADALHDSAKNRAAAPLTKTEEKEVNMTDLKTVVVGDKAVQLTAADADIITKMIADHAAKVAEMQTEIETRDAAIGEKMGEIENLKKSQLTDADIEAAAEKRAEVVTKAAKMVDGLDAKGKNVLEIQREALATVYGDEAAKEFPEAAVETMFNVIDADTRKADPVRGVLKDAKPKKQGSAWDGIIKTKGEK